MKRIALASLAMLFLTGSAQAGFSGDDVQVSLTVHTTGAADQAVFSNTPAVIGAGVELVGDSDPGDAGNPWLWQIDFNDMGFDLFAVRTNLSDASPVDPLLLTITGLDAMTLTGVNIAAPNSFGFTPADISFTAHSITIGAPGGSLAPFPFSAHQTSFTFTAVNNVPEASGLALGLAAAVGVAWKIRRSRRRD